MRLMSDLHSRRRQLIVMQTMEKNRLQIMPKEITNLIKPIITALKKLLDKVDEKLLKLIQSCDDYKAKNDIVQSMPGVGNVVAPVNRESGIYQGQRRIKGGRHQIRTVMFMAMMSAMQCNPVFKKTYQRQPLVNLKK